LIFDSESLEEILETLIAHADPEGMNYKRLSKILEQVRRNVFIGPNSRRYIRECVQKFDNIECAALSRDGKCMKKRGAKDCDYKKRFSECPIYSEAKPQTRGNIIKLGE